jgi:hypothetical protein
LVNNQDQAQVSLTMWYVLNRIRWFLRYSVYGYIYDVKSKLLKFLKLQQLENNSGTKMFSRYVGVIPELVGRLTRQLPPEKHIFIAGRSEDKFTHFKIIRQGWFSYTLVPMQRLNLVRIYSIKYN